MDLATLVLPTVTIDILHPATGEPTGLRITLRHKDCPQVKSVVKKYTQKLITSRRQRLTVDELTEQEIEILIAVVESWEWGGSAKWHGKKPDISEVRAVLSEPGAAFIRQQIDDSLSDANLFTNASA